MREKMQNPGTVVGPGRLLDLLASSLLRCLHATCVQPGPVQFHTLPVAGLNFSLTEKPAGIVITASLTTLPSLKDGTLPGLLLGHDLRPHPARFLSPLMSQQVVFPCSGPEKEVQLQPQQKELKPQSGAWLPLQLKLRLTAQGL